MDDKQIINMYVKKQMSTYQISQEMNTYPNKIRRILTKNGVAIRDKSSAQKQALKSGVATHPTKGKKHSDETKEKISEAVGEAWDSLSEEEREARSEQFKQLWEQRDALEKADMIKKGQRAMKEAAKTGSKMEKFLLSEMINADFKVQFHKAQWLQNQKLEIDLFLPELRTAIEVDGLTHQEALFGDSRLQTQKRADQQKDGLVLNQDMVMIRIRLQKNMSQRYMREVSAKLLNVLNRIKKKFPKPNERFIEL